MSGITRTPLSEVTVVGICIPWSGSRTEAHRALGRRARWEDHEQYLTGLAEFLSKGPAERLIVMGDFNQIIGQGSRAPRKIQLALRRALPLTLTIVSSEIAFLGRKSIDHIALSGDLAAESLEAINNISEGRRLSDHFGVAANLTGQEACSSDAGAPSYGTET